MNRRPFILLEALQVRSESTGVGVSILELFGALAAEDRGLDFAVLAAHPEPFGELEGRPGWTVVPCPRAGSGTVGKAWFLQREVPRIVRRLGADLVHCQQFLAPLRCPVPVVSTVHDLAWLDHPETVPWARRAYYRFMVPRSLRASAALVVNSETTGNDVVREFPELSDRVRVTPWGTPGWVGEALAEDGSRPRSDRPYFLFVGTQEPRKNLARLLEAYGSLLKEGAAVEVPDLVLVGQPGWNNGTIRKRLEALESTGKVRSLGYCSRGRLSVCYQEALALVFPSLHEGFGLPILEAMAAGLPVLTSDRGAMREIAGSAALLVDPTDRDQIQRGLERLARDPGLRAGLEAAGRKRAAEFSWMRTAESMVRLYRDILAGTGVK